MHAEIKNNINRDDLIDELNAYSPSPKEEKFIAQFLDLLKSPRCFYRDHFDRGHITASALLLNESGDKILMNYHKSLNRWLSFGGHCDGEEDVLAVAIRETMEESGLTAFKPISANFIDIDIHPIPANDKKGEPAHFHYDVRYIMQMIDDSQKPILSDESIKLQWMDFEEALGRAHKDDGMQRLINKIKR